MEDLNKKITEVEVKHSEQIDEAKRKGVSIIINLEL